MDETSVNVLKVMVDGDLVAEARLTVTDPEKAWLAFSTCFSTLSPNIVGEFYEAMRLACNGGTTEPTGMTINIATQPRPTIYVPQANGTLTNTSALLSHNGANYADTTAEKGW